MNATDTAVTTATGPAQVAIYRPIFLAGILSVLTTGCTLGAIAMLGILLTGDFVNPDWSLYVLAHANSQIYGWVGLVRRGLRAPAAPAASVAPIEELAATVEEACRLRADVRGGLDAPLTRA